MKHTVLITKLIAGTLAGYALSHHISHPNGRARKHMPLAKIGNVQITPNLKIATKDRSWHIHHWAYLPTLYLPLVASISGVRKQYWLHGLLLGAVIHGLTFGDRFTFRTLAN